MDDPQAAKAFLVARLRESLGPLRARLNVSAESTASVDRGSYSEVFQRAATSADQAMGGGCH